MQRTFHWTAFQEFVGPELLQQNWSVDHGRGCFVGEELLLFAPLVTPIPGDCLSLKEFTYRLPGELGRHCVILMQAGALSLGLLEGGEPLQTKSIKKYVVRGSGRAQPAHLKTKGKSRYGSRLRLQNAQLLLEEGAERLTEWFRFEEPIERVYLNAPQRLWADFLRLEIPLPLHEKEAIVRIPRDLPRPSTELLLRTYRAMEYGRLEAK
jgi:hypothetical protein